MSNLENLLKNFFHNIGVTIVAFVIAFLGTRLDLLLGIRDFNSNFMIVPGGLLLVAGFLLRSWATFHFYKHRMRVISLEPQTKLITTGPYSFSRNPLYLGGNVFMFFGASLLLESPMALLISVIQLPLTDLFVRREERQLEKSFGEEWIQYKKRVRRWI